MIVLGPGLFDTLEVLGGPVTDGLEDGMQSPTKIGHRIFHSRWNFGVEHSPHQSVSLQIPKLLREHALSDSRNSALQLREAERTVHHECIDDGRLPLGADEAHGPFNARDRVEVFHGPQYIPRHN